MRRSTSWPNSTGHWWTTRRMEHCVPLMASCSPSLTPSTTRLAHIPSHAHTLIYTPPPHICLIYTPSPHTRLIYTPTPPPTCTSHTHPPLTGTPPTHTSYTLPHIYTLSHTLLSHNTLIHTFTIHIHPPLALASRAHPLLPTPGRGGHLHDLHHWPAHCVCRHGPALHRPADPERLRSCYPAAQVKEGIFELCAQYKGGHLSLAVTVHSHEFILSFIVNNFIVNNNIHEYNNCIHCVLLLAVDV